MKILLSRGGQKWGVVSLVDGKLIFDGNQEFENFVKSLIISKYSLEDNLKVLPKRLNSLIQAIDITEAVPATDITRNAIDPPTKPQQKAPTK